ncbi:metalloregulator ArsR/SmtB family transcription factor [Kribbella sp. NPDC051936]|uniref:ArsR/SmtB family transcription factor n=1 Tax=Kribbella sp. NPDC051936 TaxID=3154946 RepID=UPI00342FC23D
MEAILRALADESRRTVLEALANGEATAGELATLLPIARPGVSRHLRVLREAGLVEVRQQAQQRIWVEVCEPPRRLQVVTRETDESWQQGGGVAPFDQTTEATLATDGGKTTLVIEIHGMPLAKIAPYGAGWQIHAENLATYLAGREPGDTKPRWDELAPAYQELATTIG